MIDPSLFAEPVALDRARHRTARIKPSGIRFDRIAQKNSLFITAIEFADVCREYPIVFVDAGKDAAGRTEVAPLAVLGLAQGENLMLGSDGRWVARYVPAVLRAYPLGLVAVDEQRYSICIDAKADALSDVEGERLFDDTGEPSAYLANAQQFLEEIERETQRTRQFSRRLLDLDLLRPMRFDATLPDGSRLHVVIPDITREHWNVNIRKFVVKADHLEDLVRLGTLTRSAARFLAASVVAGLNILVAGGTQAGKTTMLNCLSSAIPSRERVVTCEEVFELKIPLRDVASMQCRQPSLEGSGEVPLRRLVKEALRMRPSRIIVGEVRQAESLDLLIALNSGLPGMCTLHANSAREAVTKMCTLPLLAGENVGSRFVVPTVAGSIDLVIQIALERDGVRRVREIVAVPGRVEGDVIEIADIFTSRGGQLVRADGFPPHVDRFERAGYDITALLAQED